MSSFLTPLRTLVSTLAFLVLIDLGFWTIREVPAVSERTPASVVRYLDYGRSVTGKIRDYASRRDEWPFEGTAWLPAEAPDAVAAVDQAFPTRGGPKPCMTLYGMSFSNDLAEVLKERHAADYAEIRTVAGAAAPPNWTWAAYLADRSRSDCRDVVVWTILSTELAAIRSLSLQTTGFDGPMIYTAPALTMRDGAIEAVWPSIGSREAMLAATDDPAIWREWQSELARTDPFYDPIAFEAPALDRSTLLGFVRRGLSVRAQNRRKAELVGDDAAVEESGLLATVEAMADRFVSAAEADGSRPLILVVRNRGEEADIARALCERAGEELPVFSTSASVDVNDPTQFVADGHYTEAVNEALAEQLHEAARAALDGEPRCRR